VSTAQDDSGARARARAVEARMRRLISISPAFTSICVLMGGVRYSCSATARRGVTTCLRFAATGPRFDHSRSHRPSRT
jgi:hypothetical protein